MQLALLTPRWEMLHAGEKWPLAGREETPAHSQPRLFLKHLTRTASGPDHKRSSSRRLPEMEKSIKIHWPSYQLKMSYNMEVFRFQDEKVNGEETNAQWCTVCTLIASHLPVVSFATRSPSVELLHATKTYSSSGDKSTFIHTIHRKGITPLLRGNALQFHVFVLELFNSSNKVWLLSTATAILIPVTEDLSEVSHAKLLQVHILQVNLLLCEKQQEDSSQLHLCRKINAMQKGEGLERSHSHEEVCQETTSSTAQSG